MGLFPNRSPNSKLLTRFPRLLAINTDPISQAIRFVEQNVLDHSSLSSDIVSKSPNFLVYMVTSLALLVAFQFLVYSQIRYNFFTKIRVHFTHSSSKPTSTLSSRNYFKIKPLTKIKYLQNQFDVNERKIENLCGFKLRHPATSGIFCALQQC